MGEARRRLFFALWPDEPAQVALRRVVASLRTTTQARWVPADRWHMTLAFLGMVPEERLATLKTLGDALSGEACKLVLDRVEWWRKPGVLCLTPSITPVALTRLAESLSQRLHDAGFELERRAFRPHLTLARKAQFVASDSTWQGSIPWHVDALHLVESKSEAGGNCYRILYSWALGTDSDRPEE